jgi:hypothetical protein
VIPSIDARKIRGKSKHDVLALGNYAYLRLPAHVTAIVNAQLGSAAPGP